MANEAMVRPSKLIVNVELVFKKQPLTILFKFTISRPGHFSICMKCQRIYIILLHSTVLDAAEGEMAHVKECIVHINEPT
jgi:hypothetical protein